MTVLLFALISVYVIGWIVTAILSGFNTYRDAGEYSATGAVTSAIVATIWPFVLLLLIPYIGAWLAHRKEAKETTS